MFASDWALPIGMVLCSMNILLLLANAASQKLRQLFAAKQEKYNLIKWLAQTKLDALSQATQEENVSFPESRKILQQMKKYHNIKEEN